MFSAATSSTAKHRRATSPVGFDETISLAERHGMTLVLTVDLALLMFEMDNGRLSAIVRNADEPRTVSITPGCDLVLTFLS